MKQITLSHTTALAALRDLRTGSRDTINLINNTLLNNTNPQKINVLVSKKSEIHRNKKFIYHLNQCKLPANSLIKINNNILTTIPELTIINLSSRLNYYELALLIHEFLGTFSISNNLEEKFMVNLPPITTKKKLQKYIVLYKKTHPRFNGAAKIKDILNFTSENSASPMESRLYIKLCGPRLKGLYGCKNLKLNEGVELSNSASKIAGQRIIKPDISNKEHKVAIEYDSSQFHESVEQGQKDKRRRDALVHDGWKVFTVVPAQINNPHTFDVIAKQILKNLNQDYRIRGKKFKSRMFDAFAALK